MDEPLSVAEIRARVNQIECELFAPENFTRSYITAANCDQLNREHELRFQALGRERALLLGKLPPTGRQSLVINRALGDIHNWPEPEPEVHVVRDEWDWSE
jgi:hypothetical protein